MKLSLPRFSDCLPTASWPTLAGCGLVLLVVASGCRPAPADRGLAKQKEQESRLTSAENAASTGPAHPDGGEQTDPVANLNPPPGMATGSQPLTETTPPSTPRVAAHPNTANYTAAQLGKSHTLFVMAFDSVTRQNYFLSNYRPVMTESQVRQTIELIDSFEDRYRELREDRAAILENAVDGQDVELRLQNIRVECLDLSRLVRRTIYRNVLTKDQQEQHKRMVAENRERRRRARQHSATDNSG